MRRHILTLAVLALLCAAVWPAAAAAGDQGLGAAVDESVGVALDAAEGEAVPVIVFAPGHLGDVGARLPKGVEVTELRALDAVAVWLSAREIADLGEEPWIEYIVADNPVYGIGVASMDVTNLAIGLGDLAAPAEGGLAGRGVTVAVIDSGVAVHEDLGDERLVGWRDFVKRRKAPYDDAGHGTFVAGLIAGDGSASLPLDEDGVDGFATVQFRGVAPAADIVAVKVLDKFGRGRASGLIAGILWAVEQRDALGIDVMNISVAGTPVGPAEVDPVAQAVRTAWEAGITVVCAAGNEGEFGLGGILSPGNEPHVITVGATDTKQTPEVADDRVAAYSSYGPTLYDEFAKPDLVAPGNRNISLRTPGCYIDKTFPENVIPVEDYWEPTLLAAVKPAPESDYLMLSGTSTSAPVVAGAVALMLEDDPALTPDDVKVRLMASADPVPEASGYQQGAGTLDVPEALTLDKLYADGPALSADLGDGDDILSPDVYLSWAKYAWTKYAWTKYAWSKYAWTKYAWTKYAWTKYAWTKYAWTKYAWTKYAWTKYAWTKYAWTKYAWTVLIEGQ
ncbi:MAG TPA: S8 family peptidase [Thermoleophilia bacterium]|nr:S8 family peptidase [Thermoleophilia bacterium]